MGLETDNPRTERHFSLTATSGNHAAALIYARFGQD